MGSLERLQRERAVGRLWDRDVTLFAGDPAAQESVANRLGWLGLLDDADRVSRESLALAEDVLAEGIDDVVLLGMGGSSLAPCVMSRILPTSEKGPRLHVLDTSSPAAVLETMDLADQIRTCFIVASKSGSTIEPNSLYAVFRAWMDKALGRAAAGSRFIATTDRGSPLEDLAQREGFRATVSTPTDVGGRYSALTAFGLLPAALIGGDLGALLDHARAMEAACRDVDDANPAAALAADIFDAFEAGRDKLTLVASSALRPFGIWVEQLVAESTGKSGVGVVPVIERAAMLPTGFGDDRAIVIVRWADDEQLAIWGRTLEPDFPVHQLALTDPYAIGGEFVRWEVATALLGHLLGVNPFDEPNVSEAKETTAAILSGALEAGPFTHWSDGVRISYSNLEPAQNPEDLAAALAPGFAATQPGDYVVALLYVPDEPQLIAPVAKAMEEIARRLGNATVTQVGPRYLHSTGQLHKGGGNDGVFLLVTTSEQPEVPVPGRDMSLGDLFQAQARGDALTLAAHGRRVVAVELPDASRATMAGLARAIRRAT